MSEQSEKPKDDLIGKILGQYEILEEIGRGGMATVYRARQLSINRVVAVKVLPRHLLHDPGFFERFEREVDVVAHLEHPHILPIYDYGKAEDMPYIAMRYLAGGSLAQIIRRGAPRLEDLERPMTQVGQALDYAHQQGIIHRDIKPGNILLDENGNAYLSDFGIARVLGSNLTGSAIIGTPAYMSPEQANGFPLDARSDLYSLGIVLFELITGREPYQAETPMALLLKHINEPIPPVSLFRQGVPREVEMVIARATAKDPNQRYASAGEMARAFSEALGRLRNASPAAGPMVVEDSPTLRPDAPPRQTPYPTPPPTPYSTPYGGQPTPYPPQTPYGTQTPYPTPYPPAPPYGAPTPPPTAAPARRSPLPVIAALVALVVLIGAGAVLVLPSLTAQEVPVTRVPATLGVPTPFSRANLVTTNLYSIAVPSAWRYVEMTADQLVNHYWDDRRDANAPTTAYVSLTMVDAKLETTRDFNAAVADYHSGYIAPFLNDSLALIDEQTAPDGTIRRSYRRAAQDGLEAGQMDVFYLARAPYLVVLQFFSADSTGDSLVPTFQAILDSLRVIG